ncbi:DUF6478 family protein [Thioclava sp. 'Guangxiensis']|uniref:DUF6478 family protein n=1 Tax=Thioclava sp. 'Guangxiensis' TaxID=3149044 RepID=UPI003877B275
MAQRQSGLMDRLAFRRMQRRWERAQKAARLRGAGDLSELWREVTELTRTGEALCHTISCERAARFARSETIERPLGCDWAWRPPVMTLPVAPDQLAGAASGSLLGEGMKLFHDCPSQEISLRQIRNTGASATPFGIELEVFGFHGSFLSLVLDLPQDAVSGFRLHHLVELDLDMEMEEPRPVYCRFNIQHGPNHDQLLGQMPEGGGVVQFDLAYTKLNEKRLEKAWIDLLFEAPAMNKITLRDMTLLRHPRADL